MRVAALISHPIQYYTPIFRTLANHVDLHVFYGQALSAVQHANSGFGVAFDWDIDLFSGYRSSFLANKAANPGPTHFFGCDTPEIAVELRRGHFDALLVMGWYLKTFVQAIAAAKHLKIPVIVRGDSQLVNSGELLKRTVKDMFYPSLLRVFDAALYVGERSRAYYEHYRYPSERLFFSPHCVDADWFTTRATGAARHMTRSKLGINPAGSAVLIAGKLMPFKRPLDVVEACALMQRNGVEVCLLVAGSGELEGEMRARALTLGLPVHFLGFLNQTEMPAVYAAADALVLASSRETWGLVANEALACGTPIVISIAAGCAPDLAADGVAGQVFPTGDIGAMAGVLTRVLTVRPSAEAIAIKSERYGLAPATAGIIDALAFVGARNGSRLSGV